ncbi:hypothetical protein TcasGA2_TC032984 [Tribolium castaneum]|uniref:Uncharacterized protein n=1 Tax=Tribolium castaneum TaxID=7070 RepID=A0A139W9H3_TRICA|nr:hypothetical protein TcasGA2_TC032984 [Tribolium castaneum]
MIRGEVVYCRQPNLVHDVFDDCNVKDVCSTVRVLVERGFCRSHDGDVQVLIREVVKDVSVSVRTVASPVDVLGVEIASSDRWSVAVEKRQQVLFENLNLWAIVACKQAQRPICSGHVVDEGATPLILIPWFTTLPRANGVPRCEAYALIGLQFVVN